MRFIAALWLILFWMPGAISWAAPAPLPTAPKEYVTDGAGILKAGVASRLNAQLAQFERDTSSQIVVWIEPRLPDGRDLEGYATALFRAWGVGQARQNNGVLLLIFPNDRRMRIETGRGAEGPLPDVLAGRILDNELRPKFREGDFSGGVEAGVRAIQEAIRGEYRGTGRTRAEGGGGGLGRLGELKMPPVWWFVAGALLGVFIRLVVSSGDSWGRRIFTIIPAVPIGGFGWPMVVMLWMAGIVPAAITLGLIVLWRLGAFSGRGTSFDRMGRHGHSGWDFGGGMGGWSSGDGGGGGFSGGGGDSGGGGASGDW